MDRSDRRYDELAALYRVASLSTTHGDSDSVMNEVLRVVAGAVDCEQLILFMYEKPTEELRLHRPDGSVPELRLKLSEVPYLRRVLKGRTGELVNDLLREPDREEVLVDRFRARQVVAAPLSVGDNAFGILVGVNSTRGAFGENDLRLLTIVADRAALTIENAQLVSTLQRQVEELEGLQRLSTLLASSGTLEHVIGEATRIVFGLVPCEKMVVLLYDEEEDTLVAHRPAVGMTDAQIEALRVPLSAPSLGGTVFRTNTPLLSNQAGDDAWVTEKFRKMLSIDSLLVSPLAGTSGPTGIVAAINATRGYFYEDDLRFLTILGGRMGSVIEATLARQREQSLMHQLREADRNKTEFVSMLAHELRGPMTTVMGFGYTLRDQADALTDEKKADVLRIIIREIERLSRMVTDMLDVARMESGALTYELEPMPLPELIGGIIDVHSSLRANHFIDVQVPEDLPKVMGDKDRISQVFLNLLTNATRYSPEGTSITLRAKVLEGSPGEVVVSVADEGIGIAAQDQERVFEKFSMLPKPVWAKKGTGLGLFITKGIVEAHGGRMWIDSELAKGTVFNFTLRISRDEAPA